MPTACHGLLEDFVKCVRNSDCYKVQSSAAIAPSAPVKCRAVSTGAEVRFALIQVEKRSIKDCAREVQDCEALRCSLYACRRGQLDARTRIAGNKGY